MLLKRMLVKKKKKLPNKYISFSTPQIPLFCFSGRFCAAKTVPPPWQVITQKEQTSAMNLISDPLAVFLNKN